MAALSQMASPLRDERNETPIGEITWEEPAACRRRSLKRALDTTLRQPQDTWLAAGVNKRQRTESLTADTAGSRPRGQVQG